MDSDWLLDLLRGHAETPAETSRLDHIRDPVSLFPGEYAFVKTAFCRSL